MMREGMRMPDLEQVRELIPNDPLTPSRRPLGDYIDEYTRICEQILVLKNQIDMLNTNRQQLEIAAFDKHIDQLYVELCKF